MHCLLLQGEGRKSGLTSHCLTFTFRTDSSALAGGERAVLGFSGFPVSGFEGGARSWMR